MLKCWKLLWKKVFLRNFYYFLIILWKSNCVLWKLVWWNDSPIYHFHSIGEVLTRLHCEDYTSSWFHWLSLVCLAFCFLLKIFLSLIWSSSLSMKFWPMLSSKGHWASDGSSLQCLTMPMPSIRMQCKMQFFCHCASTFL